MAACPTSPRHRRPSPRCRCRSTPTHRHARHCPARDPGHRGAVGQRGELLPRSQWAPHAGHEIAAYRLLMTDTASLPLFPLGSVLFPGMVLPLHIFEPRYRLLVQRAVQSDEPFGIVLIKSWVEVSGPAEPDRNGTTARVIGPAPLPGGPSFIIAPGERRVEIASIHPE